MKNMPQAPKPIPKKCFASEGDCPIFPLFHHLRAISTIFRRKRNKMKKQHIPQRRIPSIGHGLVPLATALFAGFATLAATEAPALQTWHVAAATGSDSNDGSTAERAFATIQKAIDSSSWGDRILVDDGVYGSITATNQLLTIESVNGAEATIIDGGGSGRVADLDSLGTSDSAPTNTLLRGFTIRNGAADVGGGINAGTAEQCLITGNSAAYYGGGAIQSMCYDCTIAGNSAGYYGGGTAYGGVRRCVITNNTAFCGGGTYHSAPYNCLIAFNVVDGGGGGAYQDSLYHCTVYGNKADQGGGIFSGNVINCIFAGNTANTGADTYYATMTYSFSTDNAELRGDGEGNITGDPCFANVAAGDFHLLGDSPCIDGGAQIDAAGAEALDLDCLPRIVGASTDMGCYEYVPPAVPDTSFTNIWGEWSQPVYSALSMPKTTSSWGDLARSLWAARDSFVRAGVATEVPPSTNAIVLAVGAISVPDSMFDLDSVEWQTVAENGVAVYLAHLRESDETGNLVLVLPDGEAEVSQLPSYLADEWIAAVYGVAPTWLSGVELDDWKAARARSRIEWMATLVPQSQWAQYVATREENVSVAEENSESADIFAPSGLEAATVDGAYWISVMSSSGGIVRLLGKESLTDSLWDYKGLSMQERGETAAGAVSKAPWQFFMATRQTSPGTGRTASVGDSDGDGIPDDVERLVFGTNPYSADTSGEGLSDWDKAYRLGLNPAVRDTAGDGISDAEKIASGGDPRVPASAAQISAASRSIRYTYDDDDRLTGTWFGLGGASTETALTPAGNPKDIRGRDVE